MWEEKIKGDYLPENSSAFLCDLLFWRFENKTIVLHVLNSVQTPHWASSHRSLEGTIIKATSASIFPRANRWERCRGPTTGRKTAGLQHETWLPAFGRQSSPRVFFKSYYQQMCSEGLLLTQCLLYLSDRNPHTHTQTHTRAGADASTPPHSLLGLQKQNPDTHMCVAAAGPTGVTSQISLCCGHLFDSQSCMVSRTPTLCLLQGKCI